VFGWVAAFIWACVDKKANIKIWIKVFIGVACGAAFLSGLEAVS